MRGLLGGHRTLGQAVRELGVHGRGEFTDLSTNEWILDDLGESSRSR
ncbi:MAG: hypothetical protein KIS67_02250 [Verrucomicrobiae bacterium]|nr:hypothetical protein [Verrucomicrobiae bacterium]